MSAAAVTAFLPLPIVIGDSNMSSSTSCSSPYKSSWLEDSLPFTLRLGMLGRNVPNGTLAVEPSCHVQSAHIRSRSVPRSVAPSTVREPDSQILVSWLRSMLPPDITQSNRPVSKPVFLLTRITR